MDPRYPKPPMATAKFNGEIYVDEPSGRNRDIELRYLVALGKVRVEVLLPVKLGRQRQLAIERKAQLHGELDDLGVQDRQRAREAHADRADGGVGRRPVGVTTAAEGLGDCGKLDVGLDADDGLIPLRTLLGLLPDLTLGPLLGCCPCLGLRGLGALGGRGLDMRASRSTEENAATSPWTEIR